MKRLSIFLLFASLNSFASSGINTNAVYYPGYRYNDCVSCSLYQNPVYYPYQNYQRDAFFRTYQSPWWGQYGAMSYPNFYYPAAWSNNGVNQRYYAGHGGGFAGKPNVYVTAPDKTELHLKVNVKDESNLLLTIPAHQEQGWKAKVVKNKFEVEDVKHEYLFYDVRFDHEVFSDQSGFCGDRKFIIEEMLSSLQSLDFKENELKDFYEYWSIKLPKSSRYCVYPQLNEDHNDAYQLQVLNLDKNNFSMTRVTFMVVVDEALKKSSKKFQSPPKDTSVYKERMKTIKAEIKNKIWIREWGVAFTQGLD
jgi:hypothetical protein